MALFSSKPKKEVEKTEMSAVSSVKKIVRANKTSDNRIAHVLIAPWFSEKALIGTEKGIYVFSIPLGATKKEVSDAIEKLYKVKPRKVSLTHLPAKRKPLRSRRGFGTRTRRHKAYVYLKKGETITFT